MNRAEKVGPNAGNMRYGSTGKLVSPLRSSCLLYPASGLPCAQGSGAPGGSSEDCLYLNVWTAAISRAQRRPVMVWIHGGSSGAYGLEVQIAALQWVKRNIRRFGGDAERVTAGALITARRCRTSSVGPVRPLAWTTRASQISYVATGSISPKAVTPMGQVCPRGRPFRMRLPTRWSSIGRPVPAGYPILIVCERSMLSSHA